MVRHRLLALLPIISTCPILAQCLPGEVEVSITVHTDTYGYETWWQLVPGGNACDDGAIFSGGNPTMGCNSGGTQAQVQQGYGNNLAITEGPWCLIEGANYTIYSIDDWGDNSAGFEVIVNGVSSEYFDQAPGATNVYTFTATQPVERDLKVASLTTSLFANAGDHIEVNGTVKNTGSTAATQAVLEWSIDGGTPVTTELTDLSILPQATFEFVHPISWQPMEAGTYELTVHVVSVNGQADENPANDELSSSHVISPSIPDITDQYLDVPPVLTVVATSDQDLLVPRDLDFHPDASRNQLWVINEETEANGGSTVTFYDAGEPGMTHQWRHDPNAWHFMSLPTGIAMGDNNNFATSPGVYDANHNGGDPFTGPTLWSADTAIYAHNSYGPLGSHLDMLHVNASSQGIAHERWNRYWVVDGNRGDIVMNDFRVDHGPGNDYHGNAIIRRYADITITKDPNDQVVSHNVFDKRNGMLYVVDFGGQRVLRINTTTGTVSGPGNWGPWETYAEYTMVTGYDHEVIISEGLSEPAGIDLIGDRLIVSDHANGDIIIYDVSGSGAPELGRIHTGTPGIMGVKVGPDGRIWYVNASTHALVRVDPQDPSAVAEYQHQEVVLFPNPAQEVVMLNVDACTYEVLDTQGRVLLSGRALSRNTGIDVSALASGTYPVRVREGNGIRTTNLVVTR
ncbi:MAG: T9SS type A sorting domain-containing protein [Bacteroidetes bacterium]|nr:T9SS type A sorting domain-containing protein [Bacteroidota bacterium]MBX7130415.1 T9SS type A sorting domain-containing protein [Flavobacteriales bacterium]MCC6654821.1 T9SS type A sorting domain-containing protein [Flavobacteriales bacterium]HMU14853.1 T9SS type A sorting domain-containing protein [Flavobacteriales bacterium]HNI04529.1 T9SS type A sorting domain-containing protein [Flavobacteriales bacterium]